MFGNDWCCPISQNPIESQTIHGTQGPTSIEAIKMSLENSLPHWRWGTPSGLPWGTAAPVQRSITVGGTIREGSVWRDGWCLVVPAKTCLRLRERCAEGEAAQEAASTFVAFASKRVHRLRGARSSPRCGSPTMDLAEWSRVGILGIIIVKNRASAANRIDGAPSERERLCGGLLTHNIGEERRGGRRDGGHFWGIRRERGVDGV
jgi:hypothetical protein